MVRTQIQLTDEQAATLKKLAVLRGVSMAELIRQGVDGLLRSGSAGLSSDLRKKRALAATGKFRSKEGDLSERHDRYLAEAFRS
jgi:hypothetical protein